jgi:group II intron reverse transcriptase/maturase
MAQTDGHVHEARKIGMLMEQILSRENLRKALKRVEKNKRSHGVDGMPVESLRAYHDPLGFHPRFSIEDGSYVPAPVRRVEIPKPAGGVRLLGIPTALDRFIQQAISQVLTPLFDPTFSEFSYGFRPGRRGHDAVRKARSYIEEGYRWVVDIDLEKFFDRVNHDRLMGILAKRVQDKTLLKLIRRYLESGVMIGGVKVANEQGVPQGGPLSPLLANIVLDELDKELERRGHRFVRYADDCNIYVKSRRAGERVMTSITRFIENKLRLKVNMEKSAVDRPWKRKFLGFSFTWEPKPRIRVAKESLKRAKQKLKELTSRSKPIPMQKRIEEINQFVVGWCNYFALADTPTPFRQLDEWLRRRLRMCLWKQWKTPRTRIRKLISLGVPKGKAFEWGNTRKKYWRIASSPILHQTLGSAWWQSQGLKSMVERYSLCRQT